MREDPACRGGVRSSTGLLPCCAPIPALSTFLNAFSCGLRAARIRGKSTAEAMGWYSVDKCAVVHFWSNYASRRAWLSVVSSSYDIKNRWRKSRRDVSCEQMRRAFAKKRFWKLERSLRYLLIRRFDIEEEEEEVERMRRGDMLWWRASPLVAWSMRKSTFIPCWLSVASWSKAGRGGDEGLGAEGRVPVMRDAEDALDWECCCCLAGKPPGSSRHLRWVVRLEERTVLTVEWLQS